MSLLFSFGRIATHIFAAEGDSQWTFFSGNYQEYEADKKKRLLFQVQVLH